MRAGISWLVLGALGIDDNVETLMDCFASTGVDKLIEGRLKAAGLMSTMLLPREGENFVVVAKA